MFVHPNQLRFAVTAVPGVIQAQAVITRPEHRDELSLRVVPAEGTSDRQSLTEALAGAIHSACRVRVDRFEFVLAKDLEEEAGLILDQRCW